MSEAKLARQLGDASSPDTHALIASSTGAATAAVGPDNGIMHLAAVAGCRSVVLYDQASDPALVGQRGATVTILRRPRLMDIPAAEVIAANEKSVAEYRSGKDKAFNALVGQVMKASKGKANPQQVNELLKSKL